MGKKLTFLFDDVDPDKGLMPNFTFEPLPSAGKNLIERFIKLTFSLEIYFQIKVYSFALLNYVSVTSSSLTLNFICHFDTAKIGDY